jgi:hypothetical protein
MSPALPSPSIPRAIDQHTRHLKMEGGRKMAVGDIVMLAVIVVVKVVVAVVVMSVFMVAATVEILIFMMS